MKYLYYSLYLFDVKIARVQDFWPPIISVTGTMAALIALLCFSVIDEYANRVIGDQYYRYSFLIPLLLFFISDKMLYNYYIKREAKLLREMKRKPLWVKIISVIGSICFIAFVIKLAIIKLL